MKFPSYCCQKCGECIGWVGRFVFFGLFHKCKIENAVSENHSEEEFKFVCYIKAIQKTDEGNRAFIFWNSQVSLEIRSRT